MRNMPYRCKEIDTVAIFYQTDKADNKQRKRTAKVDVSPVRFLWRLF